MPTLSKEEFLARIKERIGEDMSDDTIKFVEDMSDTYDDMYERANGQDDWKRKYEENDKSWREKYSSRFFSGHVTTPEEVKDEQEENVKDDGEKRSYEELFEEREGK